MNITFFYFLLNTFCQFLLHQRSGLGFIHRKSGVWQICWWCQPWSRAWRRQWTSLWPSSRPLAVWRHSARRRPRRMGQASLPFRMTAVVQPFMERTELRGERGEPLRQVTAIVAFHRRGLKLQQKSQNVQCKRHNSASVGSDWEPHIKWQEMTSDCGNERRRQLPYSPF